MPELSLSEQELITLSRRTSLSPSAVRRLLGTINIQFRREFREQDLTVEGQIELARQQVFNIGLNLMARICSQPERHLYTEPLAQLISDYQRNCPLILHWIARGDFDPTKIREPISEAILRHASRTAGRLRAEFFRSQNFK